MERLTYWNCKEKGSALPVSINEDGDTVDLETLCARLAAYEDTGLTPEEFDKLAREMSRTRIDCGILTFDRLRELAEADRDGRVVVLPCKVGDTVYVPDRNNRKVLEKEVRQVSFNHHGKWLVFVGCLVVGVEEFGKTAFLTRAEAEAALGGGGDG